MIDARIDAAIAAAVNRYPNLTRALIAAVIDRETAGSWSPHSSRIELGYVYLWHPTHNAPVRLRHCMELPVDWPKWLPDIATSGTTEFMHQKTSIGLMHLMGANARQLGHTGLLLELTEPEIGIEYGARYLSRLVARHGIRGGLEAYNDGRADGAGAGVEYAADVMARMEKFDIDPQTPRSDS